MITNNIINVSHVTYWKAGASVTRVKFNADTMEVLGIKLMKNQDNNDVFIREIIVDNNGIEYNIKLNKEGKCFASKNTEPSQGLTGTQNSI